MTADRASSGRLNPDTPVWPPAGSLFQVDHDGPVDAQRQRQRGQRLADLQRAAPQSHQAAHVIAERDDLADAIRRRERRRQRRQVQAQAARDDVREGEAFRPRQHIDQHQMHAQAKIA